MCGRYTRVYVPEERQVSGAKLSLARRPLPIDCRLQAVTRGFQVSLTPVVERSCPQMPVTVFDPGLKTDCPVPFISPIGGGAYGAVGARFIQNRLIPSMW